MAKSRSFDPELRIASGFLSVHCQQALISALFAGAIEVKLQKSKLKSTTLNCLACLHGHEHAVLTCLIMKPVAWSNQSNAHQQSFDD